jgi:hypothetical protein
VRASGALVATFCIVASCPWPASGQTRQLDLPRAVDEKVSRLAESAFDALKSGRAEEADAAFQKLIDRFPDEPLLHLGAAEAAYLRGQDATARERLDRVLQLAPNLAIARYFLGQVLHRTGELDEAIRTFEALAAQVPSDREVGSTLERWRSEADLRDRMRTSISAHFTISFEGPADDRTAAQALESLERAYWRIAEQLAIYPERPVNVVLYTRQQFRDVTRSPGWAGGAYDGTVRVPIGGALEKDLNALDRILAHEFTHALIFSVARRGVPLWLNEGLASALGDADRAAAEKSVRAGGGAVRLERLEEGFTGTDPGAAARSYALSAIAAARLLDEAGGPAVGAMLADLGAGVPFDDAFASRALQPFDEFQARLVETYPPPVRH